MKARTILAITVAALLLALLAALGGWIGRGAYESRNTKPLQADTVWRWQGDTVYLASSEPAGTVIVKVPVVERDTNLLANNGNILSQNDTLLVPAAKDSATVEIPIERRTYEGENYRAVVQGFRPELVSIDVRQQTVTVTEYKRKWWSVTVGPQLGYGFTPAGWQPYAGVGISVGLSF